MTRRHLSDTKRAALFRDLGGVCSLCDGRIQVGEAWELEHEIPLALYGTDDETNWRLAHVKCHRVKTKADRKRIAKAQRGGRKHTGAHRPKQPFRGWKNFRGEPVFNEKARTR